MLYSFDVKLQEKDYLDFNIHTLKAYGLFQKQVLSLRLFLGALMIFVSLFELFTFESALEKGIFIALMLLLLPLMELPIPSLYTAILKRQIKSLIKKGKAPFSSARLEFYDDIFVEITDEVKSEIKYSSVERISFSEEGKTLYLHMSKVSAHILPRSAFDSDIAMVEFIKFIKAKCFGAECLFDNFDKK